MAIDKRENSVHVRLGDEDDARLEFLAQAGGSDKFRLLLIFCIAPSWARGMT